MARSRRQKGIAWELVGIVAIVAVFVVGAIYVAVGGDEDQGGINPPDITSATEGINTGVTDEGRPFMGDPDAPITVYEFADFQCPHCQNFSYGGAEQIKADHISTGQARLVWVNFPILGDESVQAAKAGRCAAQQDRFWQMHDYLFANQPIRTNTGAFSTDNLMAMAQAIEGLDPQEFESCLGSAETAAQVVEDQNFGREQGVSQTPSFVVGDQLIEGGDTPALSQAIQAES